MVKIQRIQVTNILICNSRYEGALDPWLSSLWRMLSQMNPELFPDGPDYVISDKKLLDLPKVQIRYHAADEVNLQYLVDSGNLESV